MSRSKKLEAKINKIMNQVQYKKSNAKEIEQIAKEKLEEEKKIKLPDSIQNIPLETKEKGIFKEIYNRYIKTYNITDEVEKDALSDLVYNKILKIRYQDFILQCKKKGTDLPGAEIKNYHVITAEILKLEKMLGLFSEKKEETPFTYIERIKKRVKYYRSKHQGGYTTRCPYCSELYRMNVRTDKYDPTEFPFFEDNILANKEMLSWYLNDRITAQEYGKALGVSEFYADWVIEKIFSKNHPLYKKYLEKLERIRIEKQKIE